MVILTLVLLLLVSMTDSTRRLWTSTTSKIEAFREARGAFESVTRRLSQATLNTYLAYTYPMSGGVQDTTQAPISYARESELRFIAGPGTALLNGGNTPSHAMFFQAPLGYISSANATKYQNLENLLNTWGYFVEFADDSALRPAFIDSVNPPIAKRYRFRLMEMMEPSDALTLYKYTSGKSSYTGHDWFTVPMAATPRPVRSLAENIVALVILPKLTPADEQSLIKDGTLNGPLGSNLAPTYAYDSTSTNPTAAINPKNQLCPIVQVTMIAVDEMSFSRLQGKTTTMPDFGLSDLFKQVGSVSSASSPGYAKDLTTLQQTLQDRKLTYRVFTTDVSLRAAKWSREQKN